MECRRAGRLVNNALIAVFDNYTSRAGDYAGKAMVVMWPTGPACYAVYIWLHGMIARIDQPPDVGDEYHIDQDPNDCYQ